MTDSQAGPLSFSTKGGTLSLLLDKVTTASIQPLVVITVGNWLDDRTACLKSISETFAEKPLIVRSSCQIEDQSGQSNAGAFLSIMDVTADGLEKAVADVIASYGREDRTDEVLIQPMLENVLRSGVGFSHDPSSSAEYRVISWHESDDTAAITGGERGRTWQMAATSELPPPEELLGVTDLIDELLELFGSLPLDMEFAVTKDGGSETLWLLQARPLVLRAEPELKAAQLMRLTGIAEKVEAGIGPSPFLCGKRTVYGVMPDWNPAEIIGIRPKPLALSLYRELVTDNVWAYQRHNYGYRNLRSFPLMQHFYGLPYIDVRLSFNSFIPGDLDEALADRMVDYYIDRLVSEPSLHDKVEFDIVFSCYTFDLPERLKKLEAYGFSPKECDTIADSLRRLTNKIIDPDTGLWRSDEQKINNLERRRDQLQSSQAGIIDNIYWLIEDGKRYGTLPFAGLARAGFISVQMLKSLVAIGVFSETDYHSFMGSIRTVNKIMAEDRANLGKKAFLDRYGHLRPGTYDILSPRYDEAPDLYFDWAEQAPSPHKHEDFSLSIPQLRDIADLLKQHGLNPDPVGLFTLLESGIQLREWAKFHFTKNLSDTLVLITQFGQFLGIDKENMAYCDVNVFQQLYIGAMDVNGLVKTSIQQGKQRYYDTLQTCLPPLIVGPEDVWGFEWSKTAPNFVTQNKALARVVSHEQKGDLSGAIVCIPSADPGFDWLFSHPIAGLITAWGGANSHMAIRAGELGIPAVIGAGEALYRDYSAANTLEIDCAARIVRVLN